MLEMKKTKEELKHEINECQKQIEYLEEKQK